MGAIASWGQLGMLSLHATLNPGCGIFLNGMH
jgi:hypothetical protein